MIKVLSVIGTRPEGIKMATLLSIFNEDQEIKSIVVNTAQHREMLDQILPLFKIKVDYDLDTMRARQSLETISTEILTKLSAILEQEKPDLVLVQGDTTTALMGAYAAFLKKIPVGHIEAGMRTGNLYSPFPEEGNRKLITSITTYHFAATALNKENLLKENISPNHILVAGNTVIDALFYTVNQPCHFPKKITRIINKSKKIIIMTAHRRENLEHLNGIFNAVKQVLTLHEDVVVVFSLHKNPKIRQEVSRIFEFHPRVHIVDHLPYDLFVHLLKKSYFILTDSGGIQEEASALGRPVLVIREETERLEGVQAGILKLVGVKKENIVFYMNQLLEDASVYQSMTQAKNPYGDGKASERIHRFLIKVFGEKHYR